MGIGCFFRGRGDVAFQLVEKHPNQFTTRFGLRQREYELGNLPLEEKRSGLWEAQSRDTQLLADFHLVKSICYIHLLS